MTKKDVKYLIGSILYPLPRTLAHKIYYFIVTHKKLHLKGNMDFNEKIHYMCIYEHGKYESDNSDKYLVREFVKKKGYEDILVPLIGVFKTVDEIDFNKLPSKCVLKTNHGSGDVIIYEKGKSNVSKIKKQLAKDLKRNFAKVSLEYHYKDIKPLIICEEFLDDFENEVPLDYKFSCFNGKPLYVGIYANRKTKLQRVFYDMNWEKQDILVHDDGCSFPKPKNFEKMIKIVTDLADNRKFVRVDFYNIKGKIYFGELTYTPAAGYYRCFKQECLDEMGDLILLNK